MSKRETRSLEDMPDVSPFAALLNITYERITPDEVVCSMAVTDAMANRNGVLHGGALMTLADAAAGSVAFINSAVETSNVTVEAKTNFMRPVKVGDRVNARSVPVSIGGTLIVLHTILTRGDGETVGMTSQTHLFLDWKE